jgi:serine/threonine-protein kinase
MNQVGQYALLDKIGSTVLGAVYRAQDTVTGYTVALKVLQVGLLDDVSSREMDTRLQREFEAVTRLIHPGIARVYEVRRDGKTAIIAEELVDGPSLTAFAVAQGGFDLSQVVTAVVQVLEALEFAHRQSVIHQDLKPSNILVSHGTRTKITDFGMAKLAARNREDTGMLVGAMEYMAPEQFLSRPIDQRCDVHAVGTILYELLTGKSPFADAHSFAMPRVLNVTPPPPSSVKDGLTPVFDPVVACALAKSPADRFASARAFRDELCAVYFALMQRAPSDTLTRVAPAPDPSVHWANTTIVQPRPTTGATNGPVSEERDPRGSIGESRVNADAAGAPATAPPREPASPQSARPPPPVARVSKPEPETVVASPGVSRAPAGNSRPGGARVARTDPELRATPASREFHERAKALVPLTDASIELGGRALAQFVGPIAIVLSRKAAQEAHDERGYFELLAAHLSDPAERTQFFRHLGRRAL